MTETKKTTSSSNQPKKALGRGLSALIPDKKNQTTALPPPPVIPDEKQILEAQVDEKLLWVNINAVHPSALQPRTAMDEERLEELTESIREKGLLSPLIVRAEQNSYVIIAGERRWHACRRAGLTRIPVIVKEADELEAFELALVENIQREDLSPLEEAESYRYLIASRGYQHEEVAQRVGKQRSTITNALRLLRLPARVKQWLSEQKISVGHAVAILGLETEAEMEEIAKTVIEKGFSVRATEKLVQARKKPKAPRKKASLPQLAELQDRIQTHLKTRVRIRARSTEKGSITIDYYTLDQFETLYRFLTREGIQ